MATRRAKTGKKTTKSTTKTKTKAKTKAKPKTKAKTKAKAKAKAKAKSHAKTSRERWIDVETRDRELRAILDAALARADGNAFVDLLRYGATVDIEPEDYPRLRPFMRGAGARATRGALVRVHTSVRLGSSDLEYPIETIAPGEDWPEELKAKMWLHVAEAHRDRYSDSLLNLTARALDNAVPWFETQDPLKAASMLGWCARVMGYASYGDTDILPRVDRAMLLLEKTPAAPEREYEVALQLCEAILRMRGRGFFPHTEQLFDLAVRGLGLASQLSKTPQLAELYNALADAIIHCPSDVQLDLAKAARFVPGDGPLSLAEAAWQRALELEDGMFFGTYRDDHFSSHKQTYNRGLAVIALRRADTNRALELFDQGADPHTVYERFNRTKALVTLLKDHGATVEVQGQALTSRLRRDIVDAKNLDDFDLEQAGKYADWAMYQLWNLGLRDATSSLIDEIYSRDGFAAARREKAEQDEAFRAKLSDIIGTGLSNLADDDEPAAEQLAAERAEMLANESAIDRVDRIARETFDAWLQDTRTPLLFARTSCKAAEQSVELLISVNVPEYALPTLLADADMAQRLARLDERLRTALPGVGVSRKLQSVAIDTGFPPDSSVAMALSVARATSLMATLHIDSDASLAETPLDHASVVQALSAQRQRRTDLMWL